jgi:hypothetical protein
MLRANGDRVLVAGEGVSNLCPDSCGAMHLVVVGSSQGVSLVVPEFAN